MSGRPGLRACVIGVLLAASFLGACAGPGGAGDQGADAEVTAEPLDGVPPLLPAVDGWPETTVTFEGAAPATFAVKVAADPERRRQGLMHVPELPAGVGMLFLFDEPREGGFWMKDTLVPLDIAFVVAGEVVAVLQMEPCEADPCPTYDPGVPFDAAIEVRRDALVDAGVEPGTPVSWPPPREVTS